MRRAGSVKDLIGKFSGPGQVSSSGSPQSPSSGTAQLPKSVPEPPKHASSPSTPALGSVGRDDGAVPGVAVTSPFRETPNVAQSAQTGTPISKITARIDCQVGGRAEKTDSEPTSKSQTPESGRDSVTDSGMGSVSNQKKVRGDLFDDLACPASCLHEDGVAPGVYVFERISLHSIGMTNLKA